MIPCIGIAILNRRDLLKRSIDSMDFPVQELFVVNNGKESLHELGFPSTIQSYSEIVNGENKGCAGGWNQILHHAFVVKKLDYVLIQGNDIEWNHGDLQRMHQTVLDFPEADFVFGNHSFSNFIVKRSGFDKVGWFSEEFWPAYFEDSDHWRRIILSGAKAIHAAGLHARHEGSATLKSDRALKHLNDSQTWNENCRTYYAKWGGEFNKPGTEHFTTPFNRGGPINEWTLSPERLTLPYFRTHG